MIKRVELKSDRTSAKLHMYFMDNSIQITAGGEAFTIGKKEMQQLMEEHLPTYREIGGTTND